MTDQEKPTDSKKSEEDKKSNVCPICEKGYDTMGGIRQHWTKGHTEDEINEMIAEMTQHISTSPYTDVDIRSQTSGHSVEVVLNKLQVIEDDQSSSTGKSYLVFDIIENDSSGDCLFSSVLGFIKIKKVNSPNLPNDVQELRSMTVNHIIGPYNEEDHSNFDRFKDNLVINLQSEIPSFSSCSTSDKILKRDYASYMSSAGKYGTTAELCAMAEKCNFGFHVIRRNDSSNYTCYDYGSMEKASEHQSIPVVHLLFSGNVGRGHFRLLLPNEDTFDPVIPPGKYILIEDHSSSRLTSIASIHSTPLAPASLSAVNVPNQQFSNKYADIQPAHASQSSSTASQQT